MAQKTLWKCPVCKRKFAQRSQSHSCRPVSIETHFQGKPARLKALFEALCAKLKESGQLRVDAVQSGINLAARSHFGGVRVQKDGLRLGFILSRPLQHERVIQTLQIGPASYAHSVKIASEQDLDPELLGWLKEAQRRSGRAAHGVGEIYRTKPFSGLSH
jgi:hypothetical protein